MKESTGADALGDKCRKKIASNFANYFFHCCPGGMWLISTHGLLVSVVEIFEIVMLKMTSVYDMLFSVYTEINRNSIEVGLFVKLLAKLFVNIVILH